MEFTIGDKGKNAKLSRIKETASTFAQAPHGRFRHKIDGKFGKNSLKGTGQTGLTKITNNITNINLSCGPGSNSLSHILHVAATLKQEMCMY